VPTAHSDEFLKNCGVPHFESGGADLFGPDGGFWDPHQAKALKVGDVMLQSARGLVIGVDDAPADALVVYVVNHGREHTTATFGRFTAMLARRHQNGSRRSNLCPARLGPAVVVFSGSG
jgi:hypothetical protein